MLTAASWSIASTGVVRSSRNTDQPDIEKTKGPASALGFFVRLRAVVLFGRAAMSDLSPVPGV